MRSYNDLSREQQAGITKIYENDGSFVIGTMGSGKTVVAMTAAQELLNHGEVRRVLVASTKPVCIDVWPNEAANWNHLWAQTAAAVGTPRERTAVLDDNDVDIVAINFENLAWLVKQPQFASFDMLIIDESTKLKSNGQGVKALRNKLKQFKVKVSMTGTPVSENFQQVFYQVLLVDGGAALGRSKERFLNEYFMQLDYNGYSWGLKLDGAARLVAAFKHLVVELPAVPLPPHLEVLTLIDLNPVQQTAYDNLQRDSAIDNVTAANAAVLQNKLQQIACGFSYPDGIDEDMSAAPLYWSEAKTSEAGRIVRRNVQQGEKTVIVYQYKEELRRLINTFPASHATLDQLDQFRNGTQRNVLLVHPKSAGHGIDLTCANNVIIMSPIWSRDQTKQVIARVLRRGQEKEVTVTTLVGRDTVEEEMITRVEEKGEHHDTLAERLNE